MKVFINNRSLYLVVIFLTSALSILAEPKALTWKEGEREHLIYLSQDYIAEIDPPKSENKERNIRIIPISDTKLKSALAKGNLPSNYQGTHSEVFEDGNSRRKMTLPGDIFVEFEESWTEKNVKDWADAENLILISKFPGIKNIYRFKTDPGIKSLNLANTILTKAGVKAAYPNWWREFVRR